MFTRIDIYKDCKSNYAIRSNYKGLFYTNQGFDMKTMEAINSFTTDLDPKKVIDDTWQSLQRIKEKQKSRFATRVN